jgi:hypothetical protein
MSNLGEFVSYARMKDVDYIVFSDIERSYYRDNEAWQNLGNMQGVTEICSQPQVTIYELTK